MPPFVLALILLVCGVCFAQSPGRSEPTNLEVLKRYADLGRQGDVAQQAALWARGALNNGRAVTSEEIRTQLEDLRRTFPDLGSETLEIASAGDLIVVLQRTSGTHKGIAQTEIYGGMLRGARPTGRRFEILRTHWWRIKDGRIVWHQVVADDLGMMRQLGLMADTLPTDKLVAPTKE
ncbi:MAG TPA: ester cyclase [Steroidobacteraceae bacterium]|nr:ester cyclase [Steroidobacteraceae bacterium]